MESFFLNSGLSWTMSKVLPFIIMLLWGILMCWGVRKYSRIKWVRIMAFVLILLPMFGYFAINPIYEGDFSDEYRTESFEEGHIDLVKGRFTVLAIPYCEFCEAAIKDVNLIKSRVGADTEIDFIVCTTNKEDLDFYKKKLDKGINVKIVKNMRATVKLAKGQFPAFVFPQKDEKIRVWSNNQFGLAAKDWVEERLN